MHRDSFFGYAWKVYSISGVWHITAKTDIIPDMGHDMPADLTTAKRG